MSQIDYNKPINPFARRPKPRNTKERKIKTYKNPFAKKIRKKSNDHHGTSMDDLINNEDEFALKTERRIRDDNNSRKSNNQNNSFQEPPRVSQRPSQPQTFQPNPPANLVNDVFGGDPIATMGANLAGNMLKNKISSLQVDSWAYRFFNSSFSSYFEIDNSYLLRKLRYLVFPFYFKENLPQSDANEMEFNGVSESPSKSVFQTDLYIPVMSFVTYVLLACMSLGLNDKYFFC